MSRMRDWAARHRAFLLVLVLAALTAHTLALMLLYRAGLPGRVLTVVSSWKEVMFGTAATVLVLWTATRDRRAGFRFAPADYLVIALIVLVVMEGAAAVLFGHLLPRTAVLYGIRFYAVQLAAYVVGRLLPLGRKDLRVLFWAILIGAAITGVIAFFERLLTDQMYINLVEALGYKAYFGDYVHQALEGPGPTAAANWVDAGHGIGRRAGSVYIVSKPFALALLVAVPVAVALAGRVTGRTRWLVWGAGALIGLGLALSYTRAAIVIGAAMALAVALLLRRWQVLPGFAIGLVAGFLLFAAEVAYFNPQSGVRPTAGQSRTNIGNLTINDSSDTEHLRSWTQSIKSALRKPVFGWGPGAANGDSARFVKPGQAVPITLGSENVFLQVFEELGLVGLLLYAGLFLALLLAGWRVYRRGPPDAQEPLLGLVIVPLIVGVAGVGITTPIWSGAFLLTFVFWWLAGVTVEAQVRALPEVEQRRESGRRASG